MTIASRRMRAPWLASIVVLALAAPAAAQDVTTQFWPEIDTFVRLNDHMRIYVPLSKTRVGTDGSDQDGTVGAYLDYYVLPLAKFGVEDPSNVVRTRRILLRAGYSYTVGDDGQPATNAFTAEGTARLTLPWGLLLSDRSRFDLLFSGGDFDPRYRNRIRMDGTVDFGKWSLNPYAYGEFFYDFDQGDWLKTRATVGLEAHVWERVVPELYFQRDFGSASGSIGDVKGFGLVVSIYLR